jgi:hypothetical protein
MSAASVQLGGSYKQMLAMKLVRLIETHSEELSRGLAHQLRTSERTTDYRKLRAEDLRPAAADVYRNLGEWLLRKTEVDISNRFRDIAARRAAEGIRIHQYVWAIMLSRDYLWRFLRRECFADSIVELHAELELQLLLNQFFDRAVYHAIVGYEEALQQSTERGNLARARDLAVSIGLISEASPRPLETENS